MLKNIIIIALILLVLGFYIAPKETKNLVDQTGKATAEVGKKAVDEVRNNQELKDAAKGVISQVAKNITQGG